MFLPLVEPLKRAGVKVKFVAINGFHYVEHNPDRDSIKYLDVCWLNLSVNKMPKSKLKYFWVIYKELLPMWQNYLRKVKAGVVVAPDYAAIHRLMLNLASECGFKKASMQDGCYVATIKEYGSELENKYRKGFKKLIIRTPLERYINREFGAASDYWGLYGEAVKQRLCTYSGFPKDRTQVIGSTRHALLKEKLNKLVNGKKAGKFKMICLPTTFPCYHDKLLYASQDEALKWLLEAAVNLDKKNGLKVSIDLKVKAGYDHHIKHYEQLLEHPIVRVLNGYSNLEKLIALADLVVTTGGTSSLDAAVCRKPVIQIAPEYLSDRLIFISGLPLAKNVNEVQKLMEDAALDPQKFYEEKCLSARQELADIDPGWNSIKATTEWLLSIAENHN